MSFDKTKPHDVSFGGATHGFRVQDGKTYDHEGNEVNKSGAAILTRADKVAPNGVAPNKKGAKEVVVDKTPEQLAAEAELAAQGNV